MNASRWISVTSDQVIEPRHPSDATWTTETPSAYDVPSHVRSEYDETTGILEIEFRYLEHEALKTIRIDEYATVVVGERSRRVWALNFNARAYMSDRQALQSHARNWLTHVDAVEKKSKDIAARVIDLKGKKLFNQSSLVHI